MDEQRLHDWKTAFADSPIEEIKYFASLQGNSEEAHALRRWIARREHDEATKRTSIEDARLAAELAVAERSAKAAERSARWAGFAIAISLAALIVAAWPFVDKP